MKIHYGECAYAFICALNELNGYVATVTTSDGVKRDILLNDVDDDREESVLLGEAMVDNKPTGQLVEINLNDIDLVEVRKNTVSNAGSATAGMTPVGTPTTSPPVSTQSPRPRTPSTSSSATRPRSFSRATSTRTITARTTGWWRTTNDNEIPNMAAGFPRLLQHGV